MIPGLEGDIEISGDDNMYSITGRLEARLRPKRARSCEFRGTSATGEWMAEQKGAAVTSRRAL
jgi:hypothetical protein